MEHPTVERVFRRAQRLSGDGPLFEPRISLRVQRRGRWMSETDPAIEVRSLSKDYRVHRRQAGFLNSLRSVFHRSYEMVHAVNNLSFVIRPGEPGGFLRPNAAGARTTRN